MDAVVPYIHDRKQFGQPIGEFQLMQAKIADMYTALNACRAYVYAVAKACDAGQTTRFDAAGAILLASENAFRVSGEAVQALEQALRAQVQRVAQDGVTESELQRVKTQWVASEVYKLDSVFNQARELGVAWTLGLALLEGWPADDDSAGYYAFNDVHWLMALLCAGEMQPAEQWLARCAERALVSTDAGRSNHQMSREVGLPLMRAKYTPLAT